MYAYVIFIHLILIYVCIYEYIDYQIFEGRFLNEMDGENNTSKLRMKRKTEEKELIKE